jgi:hypothetical protein
MYVTDLQQSRDAVNNILVAHLEGYDRAGRMRGGTGQERSLSLE